MENSSCFVNGSTSLINKSCNGNGAAASKSIAYSETYVLTGTVFFSVLIPVIVVGNAFVILAFATTRRLRTTTNYFVVSLAVADILVGALSLPIFTVVINKGRLWQIQHPTATKLWTSIDMITAIASIVNLMYISIDRFICIQYPFRYHTMLSKTKVIIMIVLSWLYGVLNSSLVMLTYKQERPRPDVMLAITIMAFIIPLLVLLIMYIRVGKIALSHRIRINAREERENKENKNKGTLSLLRELKATRTLAVVVGTFVLCFIGYFVLLLRTSICLKWQNLQCKSIKNEYLVISFQWIKNFNSSLNPFIYAIMNSDMRKALKRFITGRMLSSETSSEMH